MTTSAQMQQRKRTKAVGSRKPPTKAVGELDRTIKRHRAAHPTEFKTSVLNIRLKDEVKEGATKVLADLGISLSEAVRVFLGRIAREKVFPFDLEVPNPETAAGLAASRNATEKRFSTAAELFDDLEGISVD